MELFGELEYFDNAGNVQQETIAPENGWVADGRSVRNSRLGVELAYSFDGETLRVPLTELYESGRSQLKTLVLLPGYVGGVEGDGGELLIPYGCGARVRHAGHAEKEEKIGLFFPWGSVGLMSLLAVTDGRRSRMIIVDGGRFDLMFRLRTNWGAEHRYVLDPLFHIRDFQDEDPLREMLELRLCDLDGGAPAVARAYREYMCKAYAIPSLAEKIAGNPVLEYNSRSIAMRCRMGVKELPCQIPDQTPDHQPPFRKFLGFEDIRTIAAECDRQDVRPLDWCLVGWNYGGHDGAFPQIFPVAEELGGEPELRKTIAFLQSKQYAVGLHDNYVDGYTLAENFRYADVNREHDGRCSLNSLLGGGQAYILCPKQNYENARRNMEKVAALKTNGIYFSDVFTVWPLQKCYDRRHPLSRRECAEWRKRTLKLLHDTLGASMSEGAQDWAIPAYDRCYDLLDTDRYPDWSDGEIPLYQMAWHGVHLYNTYRSDINTWPADPLYLRNIAFGGLPTVYWHYIFNPAWTEENGWDPKRNLVFRPETLASDVAKIKTVVDDTNRLLPIRTAYMTDYIEHSATLTETVYSNGCRCFVNYAESEVELPGGAILAGPGFVVVPQCSPVAQQTL